MRLPLPLSPRRFAAVLLVSAFLAPLVPATAAEAAPKSVSLQSRKTPQVKTMLKASQGKALRRTDGPTAALVADPAAGPARSTWQVTYTGFTPAAQTAFQAAVDVWARLVASSVPIKVDAKFADLGSGVLGSAGAHSNYAHPTIGDGVSYYPNALADSLVGYDINNETDIDASFSSTYSFYFGTDGLTPPGQIDFESVVLHELGHGLGFAGFMSYSGGQGSYPAQGRFDVFSYDAATAGNRLTGYTAANTPSTALGTVLTGGSVYWGGTAGTASNGGTRPRLYAPATWAGGSSYSHLDESTYPANNANSLMTYAIGPGESVHSPGPLVIGMLNDMGYRAYVAGAVVTPDAPTAVSAVAGSGQATVSWTAGSSNGSTTTQSVVTASPGGASATVVGTGTSGTVTGLTNGTAYTFTVKQTNSIGTSPASSASSSVTPTAPASAPNAPTGVTATRTAGVGGSATVSWTASTANGSAVTGYTVTPSPSGAPVSVAAGVTSAAVTGLTNGTAYTFAVTASSAAGSSPASAASSSVTPGAVPAAPTAVAATAGSASASVAFTPGSANGYAITSYTATSSPGGLTGSGSSSPLTVSGLTNGTAYTFTVTATNALGTGAASSASSAVTPAAVPSQISSVTAARGDQSAVLTWSAPASNGSSILDYTVVTSPGGATKTVSSPGTTVTGLTNGSSYTFTVTARNGVGSSLASPASSTVVPAAVPGAPSSVTATRTGGSATSVDLTWTAPSANGSTIAGYTITSTPGGISTSSTGTTKTVTGLTTGTSYTFAVTATNGVGTGSAGTSNAVVPATAPSAVTGVGASAGDGSAYVTWTAPSANGSALTGFVVTPSSGSPVTVNDPNATGVAVTGLANGTGYTFTVAAKNAVGTGIASSPSSSVTPSGAPGQPTTVVATRAGSGSVLLTWSAAGSNGASLTDHEITVSPGGSTVLTGSSAATGTVNGLINGTSYTFTVRAKNANGFGAVSAASNSVVPAAVPSAVTDLSAVAADQSAVLTWTAPADNGSTILDYTVTTSPGGTTKTISSPGTTVTGLTNGIAYTFTVTARSATGTGAASAASSAVVPAGLPGAPTSVTAARGASSGTADVSWTAAAPNGSAVTTYTITSSPGGVTATTAGTAATVSGLTNGTSYTFSVTAANGVGTGPAGTSNASVPATVPSVVTGVAASAGDTSAYVTWTAPAANGAALTGFVVTPSSGSAVTVDDPNAVGIAVTGLTNGTAYTFTVAARNVVGTGTASSASAPVTPSGVPGQVTGLAAAAGSGTVQLVWTAPSANGSPLLQYEVTGAPGGPFLTGSTAVSSLVTGLDNGTAYTFTVKALNANGSGAASASSNSVTPAAVPEQVSSVSATRGDHSAVLTWTAPPSNGSSILDYTVTTSPGGATTTVTSPGTTVTGLTNGVSYAFTVTARNAAGSGAASPASVAVVPAGLPAAPTSVSAVRTGATGGSVDLSWTAPSDNGSAVVGYTVTRSPGGQTASVVGTSTTLAGLTNGTTYSFSVAATNGVGTGSAATSNAVVPATVPSVVTGVGVSAGDASAYVTWAAPAANGTPLTGFVVTPSAGSPVVVSDPSAIGWAVPGLTNGTAYTFTVAAVNAVGTGAASDPSASVTPSGLPGQVLSVGAARSGDGALLVTWSAPSGNGSPLTGYELTGLPGGPLLTGSTATSRLVTGLANGTPYSFSVRALNANGPGTSSSASAPLAPATVPGRVSAVTAIAGKTSATVAWTVPSDSGAPITGYVVTPSAGTPVVVGAVSSTSVPGLADGVPVTFTVHAINAVGPGEESDPSLPVAADATAPTVSFTSTPAALTSSTTAVFGFTARDPGRAGAALSTACKLDAGAFGACASSTPVSAGSHTFTVRATDEVGNTGTAAFSWVVDTTRPVLTVTAPPLFTLGTTAPLSFSATDTGTGVAAYLLRTRRASLAGALGAYGATVTTTARTYAPAAPRGQITCTSVAARDKAGNTTAWSADRCTTVPLDDRSLAATSGFRRLTSSAAYASTYTSAVRTGQYVRLSSANGRRVLLVVTTCATCGSVKVAFGSTVKTVSLVSSATRWRVQVVVDFGSVRTGAVTVTTLSARPVHIDALGVARS